MAEPAAGNLPAASLFRRFCAMTYDALALLAIWFCLALGAVAANGGEAVAPWLMQLLVLLSTAGFYLLFWIRGGQTIGMLAWRLRLVSADGGPLRPARCCLRLLVAPIAFALAGIGYFWACIDRERRSWPDLASGTRVVLLPKERAWA